MFQNVSTHVLFIRMIYIIIVTCRFNKDIVYLGFVKIRLVWTEICYKTVIYMYKMNHYCQCIQFFSIFWNKAKKKTLKSF